MKNNTFTTLLTLLLGIALGAGSYWWINWQISQPSVDAIMADFQAARGRTEERLMVKLPLS